MMLELERIKLEKQSEIENLRKKSPNNTSELINDTESRKIVLDSLINRITSLSVPVPSRAETFCLCFSS